MLTAQELILYINFGNQLCLFTILGIMYGSTSILSAEPQPQASFIIYLFSCSDSIPLSRQSSHELCLSFLQLSACLTRPSSIRCSCWEQSMPLWVWYISCMHACMHLGTTILLSFYSTWFTIIFWAVSLVIDFIWEIDLVSIYFVSLLLVVEGLEGSDVMCSVIQHGCVVSSFFLLKYH